MGPYEAACQSMPGVRTALGTYLVTAASVEHIRKDKPRHTV
ncbi:hypothetical protein [Streptomyces sp. NPDC003006]